MSKELVAVIGATGVYGRHLIPRLLSAGHNVRALVRDPGKAMVFRATGAEVAAADIFDAASLRAGLIGCDLVVNLATSLPALGKSGGDFAQNDRLRTQGVPALLAACRDAGVRRLLQQSIAMIHCGGGDAWADEDTAHPIAEDTVIGRAAAAARAMEAAVAAGPCDWAILRGGLFYGPGTGTDDDWFERARSGRLVLPGSGQEFVSLVHVSDMAAATLAAINAWPSRTALVVCDNEPCRWSSLIGHVSALAGANQPAAGGPLRMPSLRMSNRKAGTALAWAPHYPSFRSGLAR